MHWLKLALGPSLMHVLYQYNIVTAFTSAHEHVYSYMDFAAIITIEMFCECLVTEFQRYI